MNAQLLVCEQIKSDPIEKCHWLGKVLNDVLVETLPFVIELNVFVKIFDFNREEALEYLITVSDKQNQVLGVTNPKVLRNYRKDDQIPGVDTNTVVSLVVSHEGIYFLDLYLNGNKSASYPITVRITEE